MFGNKNSAIPYVRIGGVDRQSVLTSNANGNTPVKEIGVNANGNLVFSTDLATFKSVLDLKYSQFKSNDENQDDSWETEKSVSMRASGTLEDGTAKETGVVVSKEYVAMVNASMNGDTSTASQISVSNNDATIYSTDGNSTTQLTVTPTGAKVNDKEIATTDKLPNLDNYLDLTKSTAQRVSGQIIFMSDYIYFNRGVSDGSGNNIAGKIANYTTLGNNQYTTRILGKTVRPKYATVYSTSASSLQDLALLSDVPRVQQSTGTSTTATMSQNAITSALSSKADISAIPTKTSQLTKTKGQIWRTNTWSGLSNPICGYIWTDGDNIYYSNDTNQYVLDKSTSTWNTKTWNGLASFDGNFIWSDGNNIYYSNDTNQYVLDKSTSTWNTKTWNGLASFYGGWTWTDGDNIYYSYGENQYVLDKSTSTWNTKTWNGLASFDGKNIWTDGDNIYYSFNTNQYVLDKSTSTWNTKTWNGLAKPNAFQIWTDGDNIYYSFNTNQYVLDKSTSTWNTKTWNGLASFDGNFIWSDGNNIYFSNAVGQYVLKNYTTSTKTI